MTLTTPMTLTDLKSQVKDALESAGYHVAEGKADLFDIASTENLIPAFNTCFGNNPAAPYIVPAVPHRQGEVYDYGDSMRSKLTNDQGDELYWTYRLEEDEAILMFGNLPPEAAFIGFETFLFTRYFDGINLPSPSMDWLTSTIGLQHHLSPDPDNLLYDHAPIASGGGYSNDPNRVILFANGPRINRRTFENQIGSDFWGQQAILSTSPDSRFKAALDATLGAELAEIHLHSPLGSELELGLTRNDDDFWTLMRYAVPNPANAQEAKDWREQVATQLAVFRVSKKVQDTVPRNPVHQFEQRKANTEERYLAADLQKVADAVGEGLGFESTSQEVCLPLGNVPLHAPHTIPLAMSAVGATHDADYRVSSARLFPSGEVLAVVGVNHTETDNASYCSLGIYNSEVWQGIRAISQGRGYSGPFVDSVDRFFEKLDGVPETLANIDRSKFFVHILARPNTDIVSKLDDPTLCTVIDEEEGDLAAGDVFLVPGDRLRVSERAYLNPDPGASCGPDHTKLLSMIVVAERKDSSGKSAKSAGRSPK